MTAQPESSLDDLIEEIHQYLTASECTPDETIWGPELDDIAWSESQEKPRLATAWDAWCHHHWDDEFQKAWTDRGYTIKWGSGTFSAGPKYPGIVPPEPEAPQRVLAA